MDFLPAIVYYFNIMDNLFYAVRTLSQFIIPTLACGMDSSQEDM